MRSSLKNSVSCLSVSEPRVVSTAALTPRPPLPQAGEGEQGPHPSKSHTLSKKLHLAHKAVPFDMRSSLKNSVSCLSVSEPRVVSTAALTPRPPLPQAGEGEQGPHPSKSRALRHAQLSKKLCVLSQCL